MSAEGQKAITIIGLGNSMAGDDGVGQLVVKKLACEPLPPYVRTELISAPGPELLDLLDSVDEVWFIDAARVETRVPGSFIEVEDVAKDDARLQGAQHLVSSHGFSVSELFQLAATLNRGRARVRLYGIVGKSFSAGPELSPEVELAAQELVYRLLKKLGVSEERLRASAKNDS